ncbi:hypothetical protein AMTRI_Chr09g16510 [Amborella trichopoda]
MVGSQERQGGPSRGGRIEGGTTLGDPSGDGCSRRLGGKDEGGMVFRAEHETSFERTRAAVEVREGGEKVASVFSYEPGTLGERSTCHLAKGVVFMVPDVPLSDEFPCIRVGAATEARSKSPHEEDGSKKEPDDP